MKIGGGDTLSFVLAHMMHRVAVPGRVRITFEKKPDPDSTLEIQPGSGFGSDLIEFPHNFSFN